MKTTRALTLASGFAVGYLAGSAAGRERYEQIRSAAAKLAGRIGADDATQRVRSHTQEVVRAAADQAVAVSREAVDTTADKIEEGLTATERRLNGSPPSHPRAEAVH